ncbi:uncharacterized protein LOC135500968 [Lineus longissimus]|uniref:uncharacterized protein LOC135500968 n=1 Tax=Lineus longissimus TaxID=88925 RepID=UPI00315CE4D5
MGETDDRESQSGSAPPASLMKRHERIFRLDFEQIKKDVLKLTLGTGNVVVVEVRLQELRQLKKDYFKVRNDIFDIFSEEEVEDECQNISMFYWEVRPVDDKATSYIKEVEAEVSRSSSSSDQSVQHLTSRSRNAGAMKLPKLDLPTFNGDILLFTAFWEWFTCAVHANEGLSGVQKFAYLRSSLKGAAPKSIEGFEVTEVNYQHAVKVLCQRFGLKRQIVSSLVKSIVTATCKDSEKATSLR